MSGTRCLDRGDDLRVVVAGEGRVDAALQAHLGGAALPRLDRAPHDLLHRHEERRPAQVLGELALRERAEAALEVADVRVLDVPGDDVADLVAADLAPEPVGGGEHALALVAARREQPHELVLAELVACQLERHRVAPDEERHRHGLARRPTVLAREAERVGDAAAPPARPPDRPSARGRRRAPDRAAGAARASSPRDARRLAETLDLGPRRLGVDVVDRDRRDAAPVVDPGVEEQRKVVVGEVRRRLHVPVGAEQDPRHGDRPQVVLERRARVRRPCAFPAWRGSSARSPRRRGRARRRARFSASSASIRSSRVSPIPIRIPLVNGIASSPGEPDRLEPTRRQLVGRGPVRAAAFARAGRTSVSSMIPIEAETGRSSSSSLAVITPGFRCGSSPVSSSTQPAQCARYSIVVAKPSAASSSRAAR